MKTYVRIVVVLGAIALTAGCSVGPMPSAAVTSADPSWQHYFKVTYGVTDKGDSRTIDGYVISQYGTPMTRVQILVQALDAGDKVTTQRLVPLFGTLEPFGRSYFEVRRMPPAEKYAVSVWSYERVERGAFP
jgi:hypothetical protein